ncbi:(2Fe-2S)-binding protein [Marinobacterium arenosum]|uniref:(2Fe-2S)-binding protein n=1 Tax=Marinobacterium arenosum TaxID=2862496 RepID=UPI001C93EA21|nr:(2Fe-2S)-binding protein [Marinobacterium arenosum]MBY4675868.1 (2Fe-2S)-binding protein [Marinobacterium arenosum]
MDVKRKQADPTLVCTCNDLYVDDIHEAIDDGEQEYREIFAVHGLTPRCCECADHVRELVQQVQADEL